MDEKELEALHKALSQQFDIGDYDTFKSKMQTPDDRKNFYNAVGEKGFDLGDFDEYEKRLGGVKKKVGSINFEKSSLQSGNDLSQSQSPSPLPSEESSIDPTDIIGSIEEAKKLEKAGDFVVAGGTGGAAGSFVPNQESIKKSKDIISNIKKQGYNDEDVKSLYDDFKDFPKEAHDLQITRADGTINTPYNKSSLLDLRRTNHLRYKQLIGTIKNEFDIINVAGIREGNNYNRLNQADSLQEYYGNKQKQIGMINTYLAGEKKDKALARLYENSSSTINTANPELIQEYDKSEFKDSLDPNQFAGLETLRIFKPNQYKQAINILKTKITPQYDININPSEMGVAPPVPGGGLPTTYQTTDKSKGGKLAQETISQQVGHEEIKRALTDIGRNNAMMFAKKQMDGINSVYDDATPEEKIALQQEYIKHNYTVANAQEDAKKDIERFPLTSQMKFDQQVKEYTQKEMGAFGYGTVKFLEGFKKSGDTVENLATELFGSDDDKTLLQIKRIGELKRDQNSMYLPENLKMEGSPVIPKFSKELQGKADEILGNKDLSEYEKDNQLATLFKNNQDKIDYVTNPDAGKHKNFFSKANLYENAGMIGDIGSLAAQSMGLGMLGAGKIVTSALPMFTTAQSDYYREAVANGDPNPMAYANLHATIMAAAGLINPKLDIVKKAVGMNTALGKTLAGVSESTWDKVVKGNKPLIDKMINSAVTVGKEAGKMGAVYGFGTSVANDVADKMFFDKPITSDEIINNAVKATKHLMYSSAGLFGLTALTNFKSVSPMEKARLWELGDNKEIAIKEIEEAVLKGEITPQQGEARKKITKDVSGIIDKIPAENSKGKLLTDRQRLDYFYNDLIKNKANEAKSNLPTSQAEKAENTALVADFKNDYILEPKNNTELQIIKKQLEKSLEPKKDAEGKTIEPNEKEVKESKAELEAINDIIENKSKEEVDTKLSEPIEGLDEQGVPIGENVPPPTNPEIKTENGVSVEPPQNMPEPIPLKNEAKAEVPENTIQAESEGAVNSKAGEVGQPAKEGGQKPPIETIQKAEIATGEDGIGITHAQTAELRKEKGFDAYEKEPKKFAEWDAEADKRIADNKMPELIKRMERGDEIDAVEQRMMGKYIATLNAEVSKNPTKGNIANLKKAVELSDIVGGRQIGQSLVARKGTFLPDDSLGKYIIEETEAYGVKDLPQETINQLKNRFDKEQELQKQIEEAYKKGREEALKENAKNEFSKIISSTKKVRKTKEEFVSERKDIIQQMRADLLKVAKGGSGTMLTIPLAPQLIAIAPHVAKLVKSLAQEGFYKLEDVINKVHDELKDIVPVSKKDVRDLIAGEYNEKKSTRNEIAETIRNLQSESKLLNELERVRKDEPKTTENQIKKDSRIQELENKIKEVKKLKKIKGLDEPVKDISVEDEAKISARKKQILNQVAKLQEDIKNKKYEQVAEPTRKLKLDKETQKLQDRLIEMKRQDAVRRAKADYNKMAKWRKGVDTILQVTGIRRLIQAAVDFSIPFRQAVAITINPLKYFKVEKGKLKSNTALKAWGNMFGLAFSPKKYNRFQYHLENSELGKMFTKSEGVFSNPSEIRMDKREEEFTTSIFGRIRQKIDEGENKILQKGADIVDKAWFSERAAAGFLNTVRIEEFAKQVKNLEKQGKTPENSPNDYKEATKWVMNITGRGNMLKMLEDSKSGKQYANQVYFGARLMAAKINMLNPVYYAKMPKEVRVQALKDMAGAVTSMFLIGYAAVQAGASVSFNPDDPDFLQIRVGDKVYDISGGSVGYVRTFMRLVKSVFSDTKYKKFAMTSAVKTLVTNKFAPNVSYLYHGLTGESGEYDKNGKLKDFDPTEILEYEPLYVDDTKEAIKEEGLGALITTFAPNIFGIGYQKYPKK